MSPDVAAAVTAWYIDPNDGSDSNSGTTQNAPLRTFAERARRINDKPIVSSAIYLLSSQTDTTDAFTGDCIMSGAVFLLSGELGKTTVATRSAGASAVQAAVPASNIPWSITDVGVTWAPLLYGTRIRWTGGAANGCVAWPTKDLGAGAVRISPPTMLFATLPTVSVPWPNAPTNATPAPGDPYVIETLPQIASMVPSWMLATDSGNAANGWLLYGTRMLFASLSFSTLYASWYNAAVIPNQTTESGNGVAFSGCNTDNITGTAALHACIAYLAQVATGGQMEAWSSAIVGGPALGTGCELYLQQGTIVECTANSDGWGSTTGIQVSPSAYLYADNVGVFDAVGPGIYVAYGGNAQVDTGGLWGSGNGSYGVQVELGGQLQLGATPTITGTSGNVLDGAVTRTWSALGSAPVLIGPRPWSASGSFVLNGSTPVIVTVAGMLSTDTVTPVCTAAGGTRSLTPIVVASNGSFTATGVALDTSTYSYAVQRLG